MRHALHQRICLAVGCILLLVAGADDGRAQETLSASILGKYGVNLVYPFVKFDASSASAPMPGATVINLATRTIGETKTLSLAGAGVCAATPGSNGRGQGTSGLRQYFSIGAPSSPTAQEAALLFGLDPAVVRVLDGYQVTVTRARVHTLPVDELQAARGVSRAQPACAGAAPSAAGTVVKPMTAEIELRLFARSALPAQAIAQVERSLVAGGTAALQIEPRDQPVYVFTTGEVLVGARVE